MSAVEDDARTDVWILRCCVQRKCTAHTKANNTDFFARNTIVSRKILASGRKIFFSVVDAQRHHQLARFVRRLCRLTVKEIGRERNKTFLREPVANVFNVIHKPPPLLNHDHAWTTATLRDREVPTSRSTRKR